MGYIQSRDAFRSIACRRKYLNLMDYRQLSSIFINSYIRFFSHVTSVIFILAVRTEVARLLLVAKKLGMLEGDFAFVTLDFYISESLRISLARFRWSQSWDKMLEVFEGLITLSVKKPGNEELRNITKWLNDGLREMPQFQNHSANPSVSNISNMRNCV